MFRKIIGMGVARDLCVGTTRATLSWTNLKILLLCTVRKRDSIKKTIRMLLTRTRPFHCFIIGILDNLPNRI